MKIGYFADGPWAHVAFDKIISNSSLKIVFVCLRYDTQDDVLRNKAEAAGIPVLAHPKVNSTEFLKLAESYKADLFVSMSFNQIFKKSLFSMPMLGTINCHAGKLPFYRGRNILNWALINDEKEFGITVHYIDEGIDTGDIVVQKTYPIVDSDNYATLLSIAHTECAVCLEEAISDIAQGIVQRIKQETIHPTGFYCGMRQIGDEILDWNQTSREVFNFIRAITLPGPNARSNINNKEVQIIAAEEISRTPTYKGIPGQVLAKKENGLIVKTRDSAILVTAYQSEDTIRVGARFE